MEVENSGEKNFRVTYRRDFPPGCGNSSESFMGFSDMSIIHHYTRDFPPGFGFDFQKTAKISPKKVSKTGFNRDSSDWRRNVTAVRSEPIMTDDWVKRNSQMVKEEPKFSNVGERKFVEREKIVEKKKVERYEGKKSGVSNNGGNVLRDRIEVLELLQLFRKRVNELAMGGRGIKRVDCTAYNELKDEKNLASRSELALRLGNVPGVEVGDKFHYRVELAIVGLHKLFQTGIHSIEWRGGRIATSIVASERHSDKMNDPNSLVYVGEGGLLKRNEVGVPPNQELKGGNRALFTSMKEKRPVRVIRGIMSDWNSQKLLYVYDGLYDVNGCEKKKGPQGNMIFEFQMTRCSGQASVPWQACRRYKF